LECNESKTIEIQMDNDKEVGIFNSSAQFAEILVEITEKFTSVNELILNKHLEEFSQKEKRFFAKVPSY
jgi:hypothetical protein